MGNSPVQGEEQEVYVKHTVSEVESNVSCTPCTALIHTQPLSIVRAPWVKFHTNRSSQEVSQFYSNISYILFPQYLCHYI